MCVEYTLIGGKNNRNSKEICDLFQQYNQRGPLWTGDIISSDYETRVQFLQIGGKPIKYLKFMHENMNQTSQKLGISGMILL